MADPIRISRHGLTRCPGCSTHIKMASTVQETECPFCGVALWATDSQAKAPQPRLGGKGRALLAATVLGASLALVACGGVDTKGEKITEAVADSGPGPAPAYGIAPQPDTSAPESPDSPVYGQPAPD